MYIFVLTYKYVIWILKTTWGWWCPEQQYSVVVANEMILSPLFCSRGDNADIISWVVLTSVRMQIWPRISRGPRDELSSSHCRASFQERCSSGVLLRGFQWWGPKSLLGENVFKRLTVYIVQKILILSVLNFSYCELSQSLLFIKYK